MTEDIVDCEEQVYKILKKGNESRSIGTTNMNK